ncbi:hypothetical protein [Micromonospora zhanjiangensis]|uniref:YD repeat-containing protein n=1 Tax=Micromonospora zhanjiangensis TaxID=1522057 RepID=A0ABV8KM66_9ACTN
MGIPRDDTGGGSGSGAKPYESFAGGDVNVNITDMGAYYKEMLDIQMDASGPAKMEVADLAQLIRSSFLTPPAGGAGVLPEGAQLARLMTQRQSDFSHFMTDVLNGVRNIGSAAVVIAQTYNDTDFHSGADVNTIAFAFSDPGAKPPKGFGKYETYAEYEQRMREQAGQNAMALTGDNSLATSSYSPFGGMTVYNFSDGSSKQVVTVSYGNGQTKTETTVYGPGGKLLYRESQEVQGQNRTVTSTTYDGDKGSGTRSTTKTNTADDGTITVKNQTATVDSDGKATHTDPEHTTTVKTGQHRSGEQEQGPVESAVNKLGTQGTKDGIKQYGIGY